MGLSQDVRRRNGGKSVSASSWPRLSRPSTPYFVAETWMPGTRPGMTQNLNYAGIRSSLSLGSRST